MSKSKSSTIEVQGTVITIFSGQQDDYISLTDIARYKDSERTDYLIQNWLRKRYTEHPLQSTSLITGGL